MPPKYLSKVYFWNATIQKLIENMGEKYLSMTDMMSIFDLKDRKNFRETGVNPALSDGAIERLYPNEPTSSKQMYK